MTQHAAQVHAVASRLHVHVYSRGSGATPVEGWGAPRAWAVVASGANPGGAAVAAETLFKALPHAARLRLKRQ